MPLVIATIPDHGRLEHTGDVRITGNIGINAVIIIKDGSLIVEGNVGADSNISLTTSNPAPFLFSMMSLISYRRDAAKSLDIKGNVESRAKISTLSAYIVVGGIVHSQTKFNTNSGDILVNDIREEVCFVTISGSIRASDVGANSSIRTTSGNIVTRNIENDTKLQTDSGTLDVGNIGARAKIITTNGKIRVANVDNDASVTSISGGINACRIFARAILKTTSGDIVFINARSSASITSITGKIVAYPPPPEVSAPIFNSRGIGGEPTPSILSTTAASILRAPAADILRAPAATKIDEELREYLDTFSRRAESFSAAFERLEIDADASIKCPISLVVANKPVRVAGVVFDYDQLLRIPANSDGTRNNPLTRRTFRLDQIQSARDVKEKIAEMIDNKEAAATATAQRL